MADTTPYFELHIRPMFRPIDREHMRSRFDLWNYDAVKSNAANILTAVNQPAAFAMPTKAFGGPWPQGWVDVFQKWVNLGCPRLALSKGTYDVDRLADASVRLSVSVSLTNGAEDAWIDKGTSAQGTAEYTVYLRPAPNGEVKPPRTHNMVEELTSDVTIVALVDVDGRQEFPVPPAIA
ncbi:hypothetical protein [Ensifer aridi]|uniref:hypothetical protein n=1 Tax=Ensifer aridi TaxID=1708715 RepID=UPI00358FCB78